MLFEKINDIDKPLARLTKKKKIREDTNYLYSERKRSLIVVVISQYIDISKHKLYTLNVYCFVNYTSVKLFKKKKRMKGDITSDPASIKMIIKYYYGKKCTHKFNNLDEIEQFLKKKNYQNSCKNETR